jgi:hypothetical protein
MSSTVVAWAAVTLGLAALAAGLAYLWRTRLQLCPHCGWIVRRVDRGWLRCARCHKQYGKHARLRR